MLRWEISSLGLVSLEIYAVRLSIHIVLVILFTGLCGPVRADANSDSKRKISVTFMGTLPALGFGIRNDVQDIDYSTNNSVIPKLGLQYGDFGFSYGKNTGRLDETIELSTSSQDFQGFFYYEKFGVDFYYQDYKGYFVDRLPIESDSYFPKMRVTTYTANYYYKIGGSNKISAMITPIPSKAWFSTLYYLLTSLSDRSITSPGNIILEQDRADFPSIDEFDYFHVINATISVGAYFPVHLGGFYVNPGISVGFGKPLTQFSSDVDVSFSGKVNLKASMGYAGEKFRFGMEVTNDSDAFELSGPETLQFHSIIVNMIFISYTF